MSVFFVEGRNLPSEFRSDYAGYHGYGDGWTDFTKAFTDVSNAPFKFAKELFVDKPAAERQAQIDLQQSQAQAAILMGQQTAQSQAERQQTIRTAVKVGAAILGVLALGMVLGRRRSSVAGYRRRSKRRSRR